jgi:hypothetical protein
MSRKMSDSFTPNVVHKPAGYAIVGTLVIVALLMIAATGCGGGDGIQRLPTFKSQGQVQWQGKPLAHALVMLHPEDPQLVPVQARTDEGGNFTLTTYDTGDGAPKGDFKVTVTYYPLVKNGSSFEPGPQVIPAKYADPQNTQLRVSIKEGENQIPLTLKR